MWIHTLRIPSCTFEQFKATLEENTLILHCRTTCCYRATSPSTSTTLEAHSIIQSGLTPGGKHVKKGRHAVFFTAVNPMFIDHYRERDYDVTKPRMAVSKHNWNIHQNTMYWCNLRGAQGKGLQFYQTRSNAIILYNTSPAMCIEMVVIRKSEEESCSKTFQSLAVPQRIVLEPNLLYERQDTTSSHARTFFDHSSKHNKDCDGGLCKETCRGEFDFGIQGLLQLAVQEHDHIRKEAVKKLIHQFETHPNKEALQADLKQNRAFNQFSEESKEMIYNMGNMEYFEICEITAKIQCPNCTYDIMDERRCCIQTKFEN